MKKNKLIKPIDDAWDIRKEGKLNKNNIIFQDKIYKKLYEELKKVDDELIKNRESLKLKQEKREEK